MLSELPPELILHIVSFLTREITLDPEYLLSGYPSEELKLVPDLPSINALSQTNVAFHRTLDQTLYELCASVESLGKLALLFAVEHELESAVDKLVTAGLSLNTEFIFRDCWCSLLHVAAATGLRDMVVKLLKMHGEEMTVMVHARNDYGLTALDLATRYGHIGIVRLLAPIHSDAPLTDFDTREYLGSALMQARNLEISKFLVSEGADVNFNPAHSGTPLHCAAFAQNLDLVQFMLAAGADPNIHNSRFIPLFNTRDVDITNALLAAGANLHAEDASGRNVLSHVIFNMEMLRLFLERGVDPDHEDNSGRTALHYACGAGVRFKLESPEACVELLVQSGAATVEKKDTLGHTPVDYAMNSSMTEVVKMLEPLVQDPDLKLRIMAWWVENKMK